MLLEARPDAGFYFFERVLDPRVFVLREPVWIAANDMMAWLANVFPHANEPASMMLALCLSCAMCTCAIFDTIDHDVRFYSVSAPPPPPADIVDETPHHRATETPPMIRPPTIPSWTAKAHLGSDPRFAAPMQTPPAYCLPPLFTGPTRECVY